MYGADELPLMLDQSVFSITMRNTVPMEDVGGRVVVGVDLVVVVVVAGGRVVDVVVAGVLVVGGRGAVVVVLVAAVEAVGVGGGRAVALGVVGGVLTVLLVGGQP